MPEIISQDEYNYRASLGDTNEYIIPGVGRTIYNYSMIGTQQYLPDEDKLSPSKRISSTYYSSIINDDIYRSLLATEIENILYDNNDFFNPTTGMLEPFPNAKVNVVLDRNNVVTIKIKNQIQVPFNNYEERTITIDLDHLIYVLQNNRCVSSRKWLSVSKEGRSVFLEKANEIRKWSGYITTFSKAVDHTLKIPLAYNASTAGRYAVIRYPNIKYPNWTIFGKYASQYVPSLAIPEMKLATVMRLGKIAKYGGKAFGVLSAGFSIYDIHENGLNYDNGIQLVMTGLAFVPYAQYVALAYFTTDAILFFCTDKGLGQRIDEWIR